MIMEYSDDLLEKQLTCFNIKLCTMDIALLALQYMKIACDDDDDDDVYLFNPSLQIIHTYNRYYLSVLRITSPTLQFCNSIKLG
jgi:hypothetical protein